MLLYQLRFKWQYQPEKRSESWRSTISEQRICIETLLEDSPSLQPLFAEVFEDCYQKARLKASEETWIKLNFFPTECPFTLEEILKNSYQFGGMNEFLHRRTQKKFWLLGCFMFRKRHCRAGK